MDPPSKPHARPVDAVERRWTHRCVGAPDVDVDSCAAWVRRQIGNRLNKMRGLSALGVSSAFSYRLVGALLAAIALADVVFDGRLDFDDCRLRRVCLQPPGLGNAHNTLGRHQEADEADKALDGRRRRELRQVR